MTHEQQNLNLPYIILPSDAEPGDFELLVSAPDGTILDFDISPELAETLPEVLSHAGFWRSVFESLIQSAARADLSDG